MNYSKTLADTEIPADENKQKRIPGNTAIWVGIFCILVEFLMLFTLYFIAKVHNQEAFNIGPDKLLTLAGTAITLLLLTSGYCMVKAVEHIRSDNQKASLRWIIAAIVLGLGYPIVKYFEISWNIAHGIDGETGVFYTVYYYLTLNHLVHVFWALLGLAWVAIRTGLGSYSSTDYHGLEAAALFWHATDVIWLVIFPLFYILR
ncbi:cytochrome c oxidase subunit 3 family protein [Candidatus Venteria ishoeyi]|uniref:Cytochrome c oxidase subunit 3 n=1 Tax=Candidatus Venteria ishoeyi TaxID=1899563 RepID=A0A1H6F6W5_9GAMM|nr:cytochrome c oxidase subunit 3 family protein [Candidatus Venteria ishoeyi]MDM8547810.1 cytochrome c oxidase subunit 3 family protein [Candidatus Venteria ishoeyi]SEH05878.1 Cytochrome c oxidase subunit 3 [Candidatus Venteria ishoeyi]